MTARITTPPAASGAGRRSARAAAVVCGFLAAGIPAAAMAQQAVNPGDIIVERDVTPRGAFDSVPRNQDPVAVRATTFPKNSFDPAMAQLVTDTDLTNAHGSSGVNAGGVLGGNAAGVQAVTRLLAGNQAGGNIPLGAAAQGGGAGGIGATISSAVTGALAPISNAMGALK